MPACSRLCFIIGLGGALDEAEVAVEGIIDGAGAPGVGPLGLALTAQVAAHHSKRGQVGLVIVEVEDSHGLLHLVLQGEQGQVACNKTCFLNPT